MVKRVKNQIPRAVGYIRVSTASQANEGVSLEAQETRIRAYCLLQNLQLSEVIVDAGESAKSLDRPGVQRLFEMVRQHQVQAVIIYKLDRLFRNTQDALNTTQDFEHRGVALCSISEQLDTSTPMGKFFFTITAAYAEMERAMIAERTRVGLAQTRLNGRRIGDRTPYGYDLHDGLLVPNSAEQRIIQYVNEQYAQGMGARRIARALTNSGVLTKEGKAIWYPTQVQRLIARQKQYPK
ncbi:MAG TPA: recombinase family protein [Armatimonadota bacterium]|nr:recombinase family protein [Armatimonadota bacterium]